MPIENRTRPTRLKETTRHLAERALAAEFGKALADSPAVEMNDIPDFKVQTPMTQYGICARRIAEQAPIRLITPMLAGSATFSRAREHLLPATFNGEPIFSSTSHLTPGFSRVMEIGWTGLRTEVNTRLANATDDEAAYLQSLLRALTSAEIFHRRTLAYVQETAENASVDTRPIYDTLAETLTRVPMYPPRNFREAVQSIWFQFAHLRLMGNWPAIGRLDQMLNPYWEQEKQNGTLTWDEARELLAHFFIMGCEWITGEFIWGTGDAQHYQNIVLGGTDADGNDVCNDVTMLILEVVEELDISDFPVAVRVTADTPEAVLYKIAEVTSFGGGVVAIYNDAVCVESLVKAGISLAAARGFANDGCWEIQVPGETNFGYQPIDLVRILNRLVLHVKEEDGEIPSFDSTAQMMDAFAEACRTEIDKELDWVAGRHAQTLPSPEIDLYEKGCIERARGYHNGGPDYLNLSFHAGGMADVSNSIYAIEELCFRQKKIPFRGLMEILRMDWNGHEPLRQFAQKKLVYFGNDNDDADAMFAQIYDIFVNAVNRQTQVGRVRISPGVSTFGREIDWRYQRGATAFGAKDGDILATNTSPSPGTDFAGATALLRSTCKVDYTRLSGSAATQLRLTPAMMRDAKGLNAYVALMRGFIREGGFFLQTDVADKEVYLRAQENPDAYRNLSVRISGWSARFVTLNKDWQDMIIQKNWQE